MKKYKKICNVCGSEDITFGGFIHWDKIKQNYYISDLYDCNYCNNCEGKVNVIDKEIIELNDNTKIL